MPKRIVVCSDGTWNDPEDEHPTNVLRLARAIRPVAADGFTQVIFYDWGVGTYYEKMRGGVSGLGIVKNVQDAYRFIVQNYDEGDELFLFGFSRGAYTVRSLAGMLNNCGILRRKNASEIPKAFDFYKSRSARPGSAKARNWRMRHSHGPGRGPVAFVGVWDTVGALGIPTRVLAFVNERDLFFDPEIGSNVKVARHAVSIDEQRKDFTPTLWDPKDAVDIKQVWFAGVHSDVGGGYAPTKKGKLLSDVPLAWMAREAKSLGLGIERHLVATSKLAPRAKRHRSHKSFWRVLGRRHREIPHDATLHVSVKQRRDKGDVDSAPVNAYLAARGGWGTLER